jgi:hypothetical protein
MTELERFNSIWQFEGQRGKATQSKYEDILFSIWKHHPDYNDKGFQISVKRDNPEYRTIYRVIELAEKAGLLILIKKYLVGESNRSYHKNNILFDMVFKDSQNKYKKWLDSNKIGNDIFGKSNTIVNTQKSNANQFTKIKKPSNRKIKKLNYDIQKLYNISGDIFNRYISFIEIMNSKAIHNDLKLFTFIHFDNNDLPTGRPFSYFSNTLNPKKKHIDNSIESRPDFLKRVGLSDYFEVYDIKSEVPRVNYLFNNGIWKDDDFDFYSEIIKDTELNENENSTITLTRQHYKELFMRIYFGKGSFEQSYMGMNEARQGNNRLKKIFGLDRTKKDLLKGLSEYEYFKKMLDNGELIDLKVWNIICNSTRNVIGPFIGNLIFWFCFFIETEVKIELLNRGKVVYNVYDGFYYNEDIKEEIKDLLAEKALFVYENCMRVIHL